MTMSLGLAFLIMTASTPLSTLESIFAGGSASGAVHLSIGHFLDSVHIVFYLATALVLTALIPSLLREGRPPGAKELLHRPASRRRAGFSVRSGSAEEQA
jgi:hypothetical protein